MNPILNDVTAKINQHQPFSINVTYFDETGIWPSIWNSLKEQLNLNFTSIKFKDNLNTLKSLSSLNLKMIPIGTKEKENVIYNIYIIKFNSVAEINKETKERLLTTMEKYKGSMIVLLMDIENSETGVKISLKNFEKLKNELKAGEMKLLPINCASGRVGDIISEFFKDFKTRISTEINNKLKDLNKQIEFVVINKIDNKDSLFSYITFKTVLMNYLTLTEFWEELQVICQDDFFKHCDLLETQFPFSEPFSLLDFDECLIKKKIMERTLSNLEYQEFLFFQYIKSCRYLRDFRKLNSFIAQIIKELPNFQRYFASNFHFYFWNFQLAYRLLTFLKSLKSSFYSNYDEEINVRGQITVLYNMKKFLNQYAINAQHEIPSMKIFSCVVNKQFSSESQLATEMKSLIAGSSDKEKEKERQSELGPPYASFLQDINLACDEQSKSLVNNRNKFLEEYLGILLNLENLHLQLNQSKMAIRISIEALPIWFAQAKFGKIKQALLMLLKVLKKEKWDIILEYLDYIFIVLLNCLEKTEENLKILMEFIGIKFSKITELNTLLNVDNSNLINNMLSRYLNTYHHDSNMTGISFDMKNILRVRLRYCSDCILDTHHDGPIMHLNLAKEKFGHFELDIQNTSGLYFTFANLVLTFKDTCDKTIQYSYFHQELDGLCPYASLIHKLSIDFSFSDDNQNLFTNNSVISLSEIKFILKNRIEGIYRIENNEESCRLRLNLKTSSIEVKSTLITNTIDEPLLNGISHITGHSYFYNTLYILRVELKNLNEVDMKGNTMSMIVNEISECNTNTNTNSFKIMKNLCTFKNSEGESLHDGEVGDENFRIFQNYIQLTENSKFHQCEGICTLDIFFVIEDTDFYRSQRRKLEFTTRISRNSSVDELYSFSEIHDIPFQHIFSLSHKMRFSKFGNILMQSSISLNIDVSDVKIFLSNYHLEDKQNEHVVDLDILQSLNLIVNLKNNHKDILSELSHNFFEFGVGNQIFRFYYPESEIIERVHTLIGLQYYIKINVQTESEINNDDKEKDKDMMCVHTSSTLSDGVTVFKEIVIKVNIRKYLKEEVLIMMKLKENTNWTIIGKSKIIERVPLLADDQTFFEISSKFKMLPLQDGYLKIPEIDFMEFKTENLTADQLKNINSLEFLPLSPGSIIEGNERIIKVYSINNYALRLNLI